MLAAFSRKRARIHIKLTLMNSILTCQLFVLSYNILGRIKTRAAFRDGIWQLQSQCCCHLDVNFVLCFNTNYIVSTEAISAREKYNGDYR